MSATQHRSSAPSPYRLTRYWTTLACVSALVAGLVTLAAGHPMHGWLMVLGSLMLVKSTVWGRGSRRSPEMPMLTEAPESEQARSKWRKAA